MTWLRAPLLGLARWVWLAIATGVVIFAAWWIVTSLIGGKTAKTEARLSENQAEAAMESGTDAVETVGEQSKAEAARERSVAAMQKDVDDAETVSDAHAAGASWLCVNYNICDGE